MTKIKNKYTLTISTKELVSNYMDSVKNIWWDSYGELPASSFTDDLYDLMNQSVDGIRRMFREGSTSLMITDMVSLEDSDEREIRIVDARGKLLLVLVDKEIQY